MADILILRSRKDDSLVKVAKELLENEFPSLDIWWSENFHDETWYGAIEEEIVNAQCVVVFWSAHSKEKNCRVRNEVDYVQNLANTKKILLVNTKIEKITLPPNVSGMQEIDLTSWDKKKTNEDFQRLIKKIKSAFNTKKISPPNIKLGNKKITTPCFIRSISSHETRLDLAAALNVLHVHGEKEPVLLSAHDLYIAARGQSDEEKDRLTAIEKHINALHENKVPLILDSGNYEAFRTGVSLDEKSRQNSLCQKPSILWEWDYFFESAQKYPFDVILSFDPTDITKDDEETFEKETVNRFCKDIDALKTKNNAIVPILHPFSNDFDISMPGLVRLSEHFTKVFEVPFIAIPERELGDGMIQRAKNTRLLRKALDKTGVHIPIHLLGTGNPLSIAILAQAGADLFDGLEWCRTAVDWPKKHLHHHQTFDLIAEQALVYAVNEKAKALIGNKDIDYYTRMGIYNVDFFYEWIEEIRVRQKEPGGVKKALQACLPDGAAGILTTELLEIFKE